MKLATGVAVVLLLALATCAGHPPENPRGLPASLETTEIGMTYLDGEVEVTSIDRRRLPEGVVRIMVLNQTMKRLAGLEYDVTIYYPNRAEDPRHRAAMPFVPETNRARYLDLGPKEAAVLETHPGTLSPGGVDFLLRLRTSRTVATNTGDRLLRGRVQVVAVDRDWFAAPPTVNYRVRNVGGETLLLDVKYQLLRKGEMESETDWTRAPDRLPPGGEMMLRHEFRAMRVVGKIPGLRLRAAVE